MGKSPSKSKAPGSFLCNCTSPILIDYNLITIDLKSLKFASHFITLRYSNRDKIFHDITREAKGFFNTLLAFMAASLTLVLILSNNSDDAIKTIHTKSISLFT